MKNRLATVPSIRTPIMPAPGFQKKGLADFKLDLMALCGFGCTYCSSNWGNYLRIHREEFADRAEAQIGERLYPDTSPDLVMLWPDVIEKLEAQVKQRARSARSGPRWGTGLTLVFSMLTDGFSPVLVGNGTTQAALEWVLEYTGFRIRVLTKSAVVGTDRWIRFFLAHPGRFVVQLSCGTLDRGWAQRVEKNTSSPQARIKATRDLQDAGVPTAAMLCPIFPDLLRNDGGPCVETLLDAIRPARCETVWAEPYNDRGTWEAVQAGYDRGSVGWNWLGDVYGDDRARGRMLWSRYATALYERLRRRARAEGWLPKLAYLLYEDQITAADAPTFAGLEGALLQSKAIEPAKPGEPPNAGSIGYSPNPHIRALQRSPDHGRVGYVVAPPPQPSLPFPAYVNPGCAE